MGKKPLVGALGLLWVGLAFVCVSGVGCSSGGPPRPINTGTIRENPNVRPPASIHNQGSASDFNKLPPLPPANPLPPAISTDNPSKFGAGPTSSTSKSGNGIQQTGGTMPPVNTGGYDQGPKIRSSDLPGNTSGGNKPLSNLDGLGNPVVVVPGDAGDILPGRGDPLAGRPIASGGSILPPPPPPGRDPVTSTMPGGIPGAPNPPGAPFPDLPPMPGTPVGTTSSYPPVGKPVTTTTAPPSASGSYLAPGSLPGDPLPAIGSGRNP